MPRPLYIICSVSGSLDQYSNAMSLFGVIEYIRFSDAQPQPDGKFVSAPLSMRIAAAWLREDEDSPEDIFETQFVTFVEGQEREVITTDFPPFRFDSRVHRLILPELKFPADFDIPAGLLRFQSRIRRAGEKEWARNQEYAIFVEAQPEEAVAAPKGATQVSAGDASV